MNKYSLKFNDNPGQVTAGYQDGYLYFAQVNMEMTVRQHEWFWGWLPRTEEALLAKKQVAKVTITPIEEDLGFERFWEDYKNKVGNKKRAAKLWNAMSDGERAECLRKLKAYLFWLAGHPSVIQAYPETFLAQRRWENEFNMK